MVCGFCSAFLIKEIDTIQFFRCSWCEPITKNLELESAQALQDINEIQPTFTIWCGGHRGEVSAPQAAEVVPNIYPGLFVVDIDDGNNINNLQKLGIGFVLNLCPGMLCGAYMEFPGKLADADIKMIAWPADDAWGFDIVSKVVRKGACDFVELGLRSTNVLVNCWGGVNRSVSVELAFLIVKRKNITLIDAIESTVERRGKVLTNRHFRLLLVKLTMAEGVLQ